MSSNTKVLLSNFWPCFIYIPKDLWPTSGFIFKPQCVSLIYSHYNSISTFQFLSPIPYGTLWRLQALYNLSECSYQSSAFIGYQPLFIQGKSTERTLAFLLQQHSGSLSHLGTSECDRTLSLSSTQTLSQAAGGWTSCSRAAGLWREEGGWKRNGTKTWSNFRWIRLSNLIYVSNCVWL